MEENLDIEDLWKEETDRPKGQSKKKEKVVKLKKAVESGCCGKEVCCSSETKSGGQSCQDSQDVMKSGNCKEKLEKEIDSRYIAQVPGTQSVFFKTYGCSHNTSDSEFMMGLLSDYGYHIAETFEKSDLCVVNSCTVKNPSQDAFINFVASARKQKKKIVVSGCVPQGDRNIKGLEECSMIGVTQIDRIVEVVEETLKGNTVLN